MVLFESIGQKGNERKATHGAMTGHRCTAIDSSSGIGFFNLIIQITKEPWLNQNMNDKQNDTIGVFGQYAYFRSCEFGIFLRIRNLSNPSSFEGWTSSSFVSLSRVQSYKTWLREHCWRFFVRQKTPTDIECRVLSFESCYDFYFYSYMSCPPYVP